MGFRFRRTIKILPGVKLNINKNSTSISVGPRGAKVTVNSKGKGVRTTVGLPGSGLSYTEYNKFDNENTTDNEQHKASPTHVKYRKTSNALYCPNCGNRLQKKAKFCMNCGSSVDIDEIIATNNRFNDEAIEKNLITARNYKEQNNYVKALYFYEQVLFLNAGHREANQEVTDLKRLLNQRIYMTGVSKKLLSSEKRVTVYWNRIVLTNDSGEMQTFFIDKIRNPEIALGTFMFEYGGGAAGFKLDGFNVCTNEPASTNDLLTFVQNAQKGIYPQFTEPEEKEHFSEPIVQVATYEPVTQAENNELVEKQTNYIYDNNETANENIAENSFIQEVQEANTIQTHQTQEYTQPSEPVKDRDVETISNNIAKNSSVLTEAVVSNIESPTQPQVLPDAIVPLSTIETDTLSETGENTASKIFKRLNRKPFAIMFLVSLFLSFAGIGELATSYRPIASAILLVFVIFGTYLTVRRLHDLGRSGLFAVLGFIPYINFAFWIYLLFAEGTKGSNKFGSDPLEQNVEIF